MAGAFDFYHTMSKAGIKPIIGCEFYLAPGSRFEQNPNHSNCRGYHQLALAKDNLGYQNMCKLSGISYLEGFYHKPRIDRESFSQHSKGIIATTSCLGGEVPQALLNGTEKQAKEILGDYLDIFGREDFLYRDAGPWLPGAGGGEPRAAEAGFGNGCEAAGDQ